MGKAELIDQGADFSPDRTYRFRLWRRWGYGPMLAVVGLNPSTADETTDDPTVRRAIGYARDWGFAGLRMLNLFAFRATDPKVMKAHYSALGRAEQLQSLRQNRDLVTGWAWDIARGHGLILAAWGVHGAFLGEGDALKRQLADNLVPVVCLGTTKEGYPRHPLYVRRDVQPLAFGDGGRLVAGGEAR